MFTSEFPFMESHFGLVSCGAGFSDRAAAFKATTRSFRRLRIHNSDSISSHHAYRRSSFRLRLQVQLQRIQIHLTTHAIFAFFQDHKIVPTVRQEIVNRDPVCLGRIERRAVQADLEHFRTLRFFRIPGVRETLRDLQDPVLTRRWILKLLLEQGFDLRPGHG
jgi:hypothetical protein